MGAGEAGYEVCGSLKVIRMNPNSEGWNNEVKVAVEKKDVLEGRGKIVIERYMEIYKCEKKG